MTFEAIAVTTTSRDAFPYDNEVISTATKVSPSASSLRFEADHYYRCEGGDTIRFEAAATISPGWPRSSAWRPLMAAR